MNQAACDGRQRRPNYKWEVLALLWVAYLLNQADRQVFNVVLPLIREDLGLSDVAIGSIATIFNLFYAVLVPIGGSGGRPFQPEVDRDGEHPLLERGDDVHGPLQRLPDAGA